MTIMHEIWDQVLEGPIVLVAATAAIAYAGLLAQKINGWLGLRNEQLLRDALHKAAENAIHFAAGKTGTSLSAAIGAGLTDALVQTATLYVKDKNPAAIRALDVDDGKLADIIASKIARSQ